MPFLAALPAWIGYTAMGASMLGGVMSTNAQLATMESEATAADFNANALTTQAATAAAQGSAAEEAQRRAGAMALGEMRAAGAEGGIASSGTFGGMYDQSAYAAELDALNVRYEGATKRAGLLSEASQQRYQAKALRANKSSVRFGGYLGAGTSALLAGNTFGVFAPKV